VFRIKRYLYCINSKCDVSIYKNSDYTEVNFNQENIVATHYCPCCGKQMLSAIDVEIEELTTSTDARLFYKLHYN